MRPSDFSKKSLSSVLSDPNKFPGGIGTLPSSARFGENYELFQTSPVSPIPSAFHFPCFGESPPRFSPRETIAMSSYCEGLFDTIGMKSFEAAGGTISLEEVTNKGKTGLYPKPTDIEYILGESFLKSTTQPDFAFLFDNLPVALIELKARFDSHSIGASKVCVYSALFIQVLLFRGLDPSQIALLSRSRTT